jgi:ABC-type uncharacterized transport system permease subunit
VLHAIVVYRGIVVDDGLNMGLANAISMLVWLTALIYWLAALAYRGLAAMQGLMAPVALAAVLVQIAVPSRHVVTYAAEPLFTLHFGIAILAYALFIVATVHAIVMFAEERWLHKGVMPPFLRALPPLLEMEALLFRILVAAFVLLTLTLVTGVFFSEQMFGKRLPFNHKTLFTIASWITFGALLAGHYLWGWRGRKAGYVGSKFVLEIVLKRG